MHHGSHRVCGVRRSMMSRLALRARPGSEPRPAEASFTSTLCARRSGREPRDGKMLQTERRLAAPRGGPGSSWLRSPLVTAMLNRPRGRGSGRESQWVHACRPRQHQHRARGAVHQAPETLPSAVLQRSVAARAGEHQVEALSGLGKAARRRAGQQPGRNRQVLRHAGGREVEYASGFSALELPRGRRSRCRSSWFAGWLNHHEHAEDRLGPLGQCDCGLECRPGLDEPSNAIAIRRSRRSSRSA